MKYGGIEWNTDSELSSKLGKSSSFVSSRKNNKKMTCEEIIDEILNPKLHEYRGITWKNDSDLSRKLGKERRYVNSLTRKGFTREQLIDRFLDSQHEYRGIKWTSERSLAKALDYPNWLIRKYKDNGYTCQEIIDMRLRMEDKNEI